MTTGKHIGHAVVWLAVCTVLSPAGRTESGPRFRDASKASGIDFVHESGSEEKNYIIEVNGAGVALFDYDRDEDLDVYLINGSYLELQPGQAKPRDRLYRNRGDGTFEDVTDAAGLGSEEWGCGCAAADYDNDGDLDLYVTNWGPNHLYRNNGDGTFTDVAKTAGVDNREWGASCAFGDIDLDGDVDLYVTNYLDFDPRLIPKRGEKSSCTLQGEIPIHCGPRGLSPSADILYLNNGDGTFSDISAESGIRSAGNAFGLGVLFLDFNRDGLPDIYVANDVTPNYLYENLGNNVFEEIGLIAGVSFSGTGDVQSGMGVDCGDLQGDGHEDIVVMNYAQDYNTLYRGDGSGFFSDESKRANVFNASFHHLSWGTLMLDAECDGDLDLFFANGHVIPQVDQIESEIGYRQINQLLLNNGTGDFEDVSNRCGEVFRTMLSSRGCAYGDLDGDGDQDIVVSNIDAPVTIYENTTENQNHWIGVNLTGTACNRSALGAWVTVHAGGKKLSRYLRGSLGYASCSELTLRFGLGKNERVDSIDVQWPGGQKEIFTVDAVDRVYAFTQSQ